MSDLVNDKYNHHYISQIEQRKNAIVNNVNTSMDRIRKFSIHDRDNFLLSSSGANPLIKNTCKMHDLFTLEILPNGKRVNLEKYFMFFEDQYDSVVSSLHQAIQEKIANANANANANAKKNSIEAADLIDKIKYLQKIKLLNYIRNPHNIKNSLKMFSSYKDFIVKGESNDFYLILSAVLKNEKRHRGYICKEFKVSENEFDSWIKLILLLVYFDDDNSISTIDGLIEEYFSAKEIFTTAIIYYYNTESPIFPDTGSIILPEELYSFNVSKNCFIILSHLRLDSTKADSFFEKASESLGIEKTGKSSKEFLDSLAAKNTISIKVDCINILTYYNRMCIKHAAKFVYSHSQKVTGAEVIKKAQ